MPTNILGANESIFETRFPSKLQEQLGNKNCPSHKKVAPHHQSKSGYLIMPVLVCPTLWEKSHRCRKIGNVACHE